MDYIELARQLSGNTNSGITRKTATAKSASTNGTVQIDVGGNNITVPTIGNIIEGDTVEYIVQDGMPVAIGSKGAGDTLRDNVDTLSGNVEGLQTLIRETERGVEVGKSADGKTFTGIHTAQTDSAFEIHGSDENHTVLASFSQLKIELGKAIDNAWISLCGGVGGIAAERVAGVFNKLNIHGGQYVDVYTMETGVNGHGRLNLRSQADVGCSASIVSSYLNNNSAYVTAESTTSGNTVQIKAGKILINGNTLADHITQSYISGNWYVERYASGLVKQYYNGDATFAAGTDWVAKLTYPVALSAVYTAQATGSDYRCEKLYTSPMQDSGAACWVGGTASEAHTSAIRLFIVGKAS